MTRYSLPAFLALAASFVGAVLLLMLDPSAASAQRSPLAEGEPCPTLMYGNRDELLCHCGKTEGQHDVWGTDIYTNDSALCHAAKHAGVIGEAGGSILVRRAPGQSSYRGSTRNGFTSADYGSWDGSLVFASPSSRTGGLPLCPTQYSANRSFSGACFCDRGFSGPVWGSNPYTSGSAICSAATHAGVIGRDGGVVTLAPGGNQPTLPGSERNGVLSLDGDGSDGSVRISGG
jgi:hypothetical protein